MQQHPKISILIPCCNVEQYVGQCVESVLRQTLSDIEVICINDGSKDNTLSILYDFEKKDHRIRIINKSNSGYGDSMNRALALAKGEYVGIVESDDFVDEGMFQALYEVANREDAEIVRSCYFEYKGGVDTYVGNDWVPKNRTHNPNVETAAFLQAPAIWSAIYRRSWLEKEDIRFLPTPGASYQDTSFAFKCYACCERFHMLDRAFLHYRLDNQSSSVNNPGKVMCVCDEWREIYRFVRKNKRRHAHLYSLLPYMQYGTYKWNFERLSGTLKYKFLLVWAREIIGHFLRGELPLTKLDPYVKLRLKSVLVKAFFNRKESLP
ncbi:MAG TPA: glycosyltransferase family 2 protein [Candidatus Aphodousia faecipullorum]|nr:glycosyltransferase family 2 protein [Candidatus Aphodousia faecipullorum]